MKIPQRIIKKAIEGGYEGLSQRDLDTKNYDAEAWCKLALDKEFWIALGKAEGWPKNEDSFTDTEQKLWHEHAHRFLDALFAGETEAFWAAISPEEK